MKLKLLLILAIFPIIAFGQANLTYVRSSDSTFSILNQRTPMDTLWKFTKSGVLVKYHLNMPIDTLVLKSELSSINQQPFYGARKFISYDLSDTVTIDSGKIQLTSCASVYGDTGRAAFTPTGVLFNDSLSAEASKGLTDKILGPIQRLQDTVNGEIGWHTTWEEVVYSLNGYAQSTVEYALMYSDEIAARHIANNRILIYILFFIIGLLVINQVRIEKKLRK